jgi:hypothetical protein
MGTIVKLTPNQGSMLLQTGIRMQGYPDALGDTKFSDNMRAKFNEEIRQLCKALKKKENSPLYRSERRLLFGPSEWWARKDLKPQKGVEIDLDPEERVAFTLIPKFADDTREVELTGAARNGLFRLLLLWCHPASKTCLGGGAQDEMVWDIAEQVPGGVNALTRQTGADKSETVDLGLDAAEETDAKDDKEKQ